MRARGKDSGAKRMYSMLISAAAAFQVHVNLSSSRVFVQVGVALAWVLLPAS